MSLQTTQTPAPVRFQDVRNFISRLVLSTGIHCLYAPNFEKEAQPWELDDPKARKEWEEDVEMDEQCGDRANSTDYFYALTVVNPEVGEHGEEVAMPPRVIVEVHQVALQIAAARRAGRDREEFCDELEEKRRGIIG